MTKHDDERTPLLSASSSSIGVGTVEEVVITPADRFFDRPNVILAMVVIFIGGVTLADQIASTPTKRVMESIVCYNYMETADPSKILIPRSVIGPGALGGVDEKWCKVSEVQSTVAGLYGWQLFFEGIPAIALALPVGIMADKIGRKPIILLGTACILFDVAWQQVVCKSSTPLEAPGPTVG